jgi:hypothetical protein
MTNANSGAHRLPTAREAHFALRADGMNARRARSAVKQW